MKICNYNELDESFYSKIEFESISSVNEIIAAVRKDGDDAIKKYRVMADTGDIIEHTA